MKVDRAILYLCWRWFLFVALFAVAGCGAAPGTPPLMTTPREGSMLLPGCQNVEPDAQVAGFVTEYYLTTWGSALSEGARAGALEAVEQNPTGAAALFATLLPVPETVNGIRFVSKQRPQSFCMIVEAPEARVEAAIQQAYAELRGFGYEIDQNVGRSGLTQTRLKLSSHSAARWYDRFSTTFVGFGERRTAVYVLREVFISRSGSPFIQGDSVGGNEAWLLARIRDLSGS